MYLEIHWISWKCEEAKCNKLTWATCKNGEKILSFNATIKNSLILRQRNINWQVSSVTVKTFDVTMQCVEDVIEIIGLKLQFSSWFSIHILLHRLYRFYYQINSIYKCVIIESNVLHRSISFWESLSCKIFL